jgi:hypothetical protein
MKILVNKCPDTGTLFESDQAYKTFRQRFLRQKRALAVKEKSEQEVQSLIKDFQDTCASFSELEEWLTQPTTLKTIMKHSRVESTLDHVQFIHMRFSDACSNSHAAPKGGETNWHRNRDKPLSYPGWQGRLKYTTNYDHISLTSGFFRILGVHSGAGGARDGHSEYDVTVFQSDWPMLEFTAHLLQGI